MTTSNKKKFAWTEEKIRFLRDASENMDFSHRLAENAAAFFSHDDTVCDMGCGLGYLAIALLPFFSHVDAIDHDPDALSVLKENILLQDIKNLTAWSEDVMHLPAERKYDVLTFAFFGQMHEIAALTKRHARKGTVAFRRNEKAHRFSNTPTQRERLYFPADCAWLDKEGIAYRTESFVVDMGQPFRSQEDARLFFRIHGRDEIITEETMEKRLNSLVKTDSETFPWHYPMYRKISMIILNPDDIPEEYAHRELVQN